VRAIKIPHDPQQQMSLINVTGWKSMADAIGEGCEYIERVNCTLTPDYRMVMVVDEDGLYRGQHPNPRGQMLYPFSPIVGTVLVMTEGDTPDGVDFVDLADPDLALALVEEATT
jgi:hypothetical protein